MGAVRPADLAPPLGWDTASLVNLTVGFVDESPSSAHPANFTVLAAAIVTSLGSGVMETPVKRREMYIKWTSRDVHGKRAFITSEPHFSRRRLNSQGIACAARISWPDQPARHVSSSSSPFSAHHCLSALSTESASNEYHRSRTPSRSSKFLKRA